MEKGKVEEEVKVEKGLRMKEVGCKEMEKELNDILNAIETFKTKHEAQRFI